ncbi:hypothetical protein KV580_23495 [Pseudomonas chlororaphis]|nr:hypothetical protein [Pseudomonas chlororaphis]
MNSHHYLLTLVLRKKSLTGKDVAFLVSGTKVIAIGEAGDKAYETAVVNLLHNHPNTSKLDVYSSCIPTEMCLGLCWQARVNAIVYPKNFAAKIVFPTDSAIRNELSLNAKGELDIPKRITGAGWQAKKLKLNTFPTSTPLLTEWIELFNSDALELTPTANTLYTQMHGCNEVYDSRVNKQSELDMLTRVASSVPAQEGACVTEQNNKDRLWMKIAYALAGATLPHNRGAGRLSSGHNVAAVMVSNTDVILGWGVNINGLNGCFHAETSMVLAYLIKSNTSKLPEGVRIFSTLAPCHMCAGLITTLGNNVPVVVGHIDPRIKNSALDLNKNGSIQHLTSMMPIVRKPVTAVKDADPAVFDHAGWVRSMIAKTGKLPSPGDWLDAQHAQEKQARGVTTFLRHNPAPTQLFQYSLTSLQELLDSLVGDPGENKILERGIALIKKIREKGLIR